MCERENKEGEKEGEWTKVKGKFHKSKDKDGLHPGSSPSVKFYVSNIPDGCRPGDLAAVLKECGELGGVYIARKGNKEGSIFGFATFKGVRDTKELERWLGKIKMGKESLKVNVARFTAENDRGGRVKYGHNVERGKGGSESKWKQASPNGGVSFRDALLGSMEDKKVERTIRIDESKVCELMGMPKTDLVGKCSNLGSMIVLEEAIVVAGFCKFRIFYLGGLNCRVSFESESLAKQFFYNKAVWRGWLPRLEAWSGQYLAYERLAWIKMIGVPLHLASSYVYNAIAKKMGKIIQPSEAMEDIADQSAGKVGILVGEGKVVEAVVTLLWKDERFKIWVREAGGDWAPSFSESGTAGSEHGDSVTSPWMASETEKVKVRNKKKDEKMVEEEEAHGETVNMGNGEDTLGGKRNPSYMQEFIPDMQDGMFKGRVREERGVTDNVVNGGDTMHEELNCPSMQYINLDMQKGLLEGHSSRKVKSKKRAKEGLKKSEVIKGDPIAKWARSLTSGLSRPNKRQRVEDIFGIDKILAQLDENEKKEKKDNTCGDMRTETDKVKGRLV